ncbi:MAG: D-alanyl-D-alanine carboxypeptidase [Oscillospiraceae bacterium]|nr:D-alanyl-D-alanine carboxypeptidase [Oscillospiraceae bacterium]
MKNLISFLTAAMLFYSFSAPVFAYTAEESNLPEAKSFILIEAETGEMLFVHNPNERLPVSSLAKIMTLLIIAEELEAGRISMSDDVPASAAASAAAGSVIWLNAGEILPLSELVKSVVIASSNDATIALAEYIAGNTEEFTALMNRRAAELNMNDTLFSDPCGISAGGYSTAADIAVMTAVLFKHDVFNHFYTIRLDSVRTGTERETQLVNTNKLAHWYNGLLGGKAGQSAEAGFCLLNCAERSEMRLISVILGAKTEEDRVNLCETLLDNGFRDFELFTPELDTTQFSPVKVERGIEKLVEAAPRTPVKFIAPKGQGGKSAKYEYSVPESITAPVEEGQVIGTLTVHMSGKQVAQTELTALHAVEELTFIKSLKLMLKSFFRF